MALSETEIEELIDVHKMNEQMGATVEALQRDLMEKFSLRTNTGTVGPLANTPAFLLLTFVIKKQLSLKRFFQQKIVRLDFSK